MKSQVEYAQIRAACNLHPHSGAWAFFMREIVRLPNEMSHTVLQVIRLEKWQDASDPIAAIRSHAIEVHHQAWSRHHLQSINERQRAQASNSSHKKS